MTFEFYEWRQRFYREGLTPALRLELRDLLAPRVHPIGWWLLSVARTTLVRALEGSSEQSAEYWHNRVLPYLKRVWPKSQHILTSAIANNFARLCIAAGDKFAEAVRELQHWLRPLNDSGFIVQRLHESNLSGKFPNDALVFLDSIIRGDAQWPPAELRPCLDAIREAQPALAVDERFTRLTNFLRRVGA
jgi:hypothetical protein